MSRLTRDGTAETVSRDRILRHERGQGNIHFPCSADHEQDWQPYRTFATYMCDHTYIHHYHPACGPSTSRVSSKLLQLIITNNLPVSPRCTAYEFLSPCKFSSFTTPALTSTCAGCLLGPLGRRLHKNVLCL